MPCQAAAALLPAGRFWLGLLVQHRADAASAAAAAVHTSRPVQISSPAAKSSLVLNTSSCRAVVVAGAYLRLAQRLIVAMLQQVHSGLLVIFCSLQLVLQLLQLSAKTILCRSMCSLQ